MNDDDVKDVIAEEKARGKRRVDPQARREFQRLKREARLMLSMRDLRSFEQELLRLGLRPGSPEYEAAVKIWRESS